MPSGKVDNVAMNELEDKIKQAKEYEEKSDFLGASLLYKDALQLAQKLNLSKEIRELKAKVVEVSKKIDFKSFEVEQQIPTEVLEKFVDAVITQSDDLPAILKRMSRMRELCPKAEYVREQTKRTMPVTYQIASLATYSADGHVIDGGSDPQLAWYAKMYEINQGIISDLYLNRLFVALKERKGLDQHTLYSYIESRRTFPPRSLPLIKKGIEAYFSGDYISALHILVPQFEGVFLSLSERVGIDIIALNRGSDVSTRTKVLSENHLSSKEFIEKWSEDLCEQIKFILFNPLGHRLRHKIAHGEIDPQECNQRNTELVLYLHLVLAGCAEITPKEGKPQ